MATNDKTYMTPGAKRAFHSYRRNAIIGFVILLFGIGFVRWEDGQRAEDQRQAIADQSAEADKAIVQSGRTISVAGCNRDFRTIRRLRRLIGKQHGEIDRFVAEGTLTKTQGARQHVLIDKQIEQYKLPDCRKAAVILTSNPRNAKATPEPLHP